MKLRIILLGICFIFIILCSCVQGDGGKDFISGNISESDQLFADEGVFSYPENEFELETYMLQSTTSILEIHSTFQSVTSVTPNGQVVYIIRVIDSCDGVDLKFQWQSYDGTFSQQEITHTDVYCESRVLWQAPGCSSSTRTISVTVTDCDGNSVVKEFLPVTVFGGQSCQVHMPMFDPPGGKYNDKLLIALLTDTPGAVIKYTTDGSDPRMSPFAITGSTVTISESTIIRGLCFCFWMA